VLLWCIGEGGQDSLHRRAPAPALATSFHAATTTAEKGEGAEEGKEEERIVLEVQTRLQSFQAFLLAKREYVNGEGVGGVGGGGGGEEEEGGAVRMNM